MEYQSYDGHGVDVAVNRIDDLDKRALAYIQEHSHCTALDLGSGAGGQSVRMANAGAVVVAIDQFNFTSTFVGLRSEYNLSDQQLQFKQGNIVQIESLIPDQQFDVTMLQRSLHYLQYEQAHKLLRYVHSITTEKLYIAVTGSESLVGDTYPCKANLIEDRFCQLSDLGKDMFQIHESVCLYSQDELVTLLTEASWKIDDVWMSAFGNVKAVCSR